MACTRKYAEYGQDDLSNAIDHLAKGLLGNEKSARYLKRQGADGRADQCFIDPPDAG